MKIFIALVIACIFAVAFARDIPQNEPNFDEIRFRNIVINNGGIGGTATSFNGNAVLGVGIPGTIRIGNRIYTAQDFVK